MLQRKTSTTETFRLFSSFFFLRAFVLEFWGASFHSNYKLQPGGETRRTRDSDPCRWEREDQWILCYGVIVSEQIRAALKQSRCPLSSTPASGALSCTVRLRNDKSKASRRIRARSCVFRGASINLCLLLDLNSFREIVKAHKWLLLHLLLRKKNKNVMEGKRAEIDLGINKGQEEMVESIQQESSD